MQRRGLGSRLGWHLLLALMLLWMQQAGLRHALQHAALDDAAPTHAACLDCLAYHADQHGLAPSVATPTLAPLHHVLQTSQALAQGGQSAWAAYLPRAPPVCSA